MQLDFEEIKRLIPQRFPFIMIDRVIELEPGKRVVAIKNVTGNDILFLGHFPEKAVFPGAAILEAMAQAAIVLFAASQPKKDDEPRTLYYFGSVKARFLAPVTPGDQIRITVVNVKTLPTGAFVEGTANVGENKISEAELVFSAKHE
jgi:3-hydroxyacyl-[acyl-carrier-protein] dehydratase